MRNLALETLIAWTFILQGLLCLAFAGPITRMIDKFNEKTRERSGFDYPPFSPLVCRIFGLTMIVIGAVWRHTQ